MGGFISLLTFCFALLVITLMFNGSGTEAECGETVSGTAYNTPDQNCSSNCPNLCKGKKSCQKLSDPCDLNYPKNISHPCHTCDPCRKCRDEYFNQCKDLYQDPNVNCDPCKLCNGSVIDFCNNVIRGPPSPPPSEPVPIFNYCTHPFTGGVCKLHNNASCFCTCD